MWLFASELKNVVIDGCFDWQIKVINDYYRTIISCSGSQTITANKLLLQEFYVHELWIILKTSHCCTSSCSGNCIFHYSGTSFATGQKDCSPSLQKEFLFWYPTITKEEYKKIPHLQSTSKSESKIVKTEAKSIPLTHILHDR